MEEGNSISKPLNPAIQIIRRRLMEPPGIEKRVEEFLAAIRISIAPPLLQQTGLRKSLADRLSFKNKPQQPQTLSVNEMKNRINSLKDTQHQHQFSDSGVRKVYDPDFLYQLQFSDLSCIRPANLAKCLTRKTLPFQVLQKTAANRGRGRGRGLRGNDNRNVGYGRGEMLLENQVGLENEEDTFESQDHHDIGREYGRGRGNIGEGRGSGIGSFEGRGNPRGTSYGIGQYSEQSLRGGIGGYGRGDLGTGNLQVGHEKEDMRAFLMGDDRMGHSDVSMGHARGQGPLQSSYKGNSNADKIAPNEVPSTHCPPPNIEAPKDNSFTPVNPLGKESNSNVIQLHTDSQPQNNNGIIDDKKTIPKPLGEKKILLDIPCDQKKPSETPDAKLLDEKKLLLEIPEKVEEKTVLPIEKESVLPVKEEKTVVSVQEGKTVLSVQEEKTVGPVKNEIFNLIHSARLGQPTSDKDLKSSDKPDVVEHNLLQGTIDDKKSNLLPVTIDVKKGDLLQKKVDDKKGDLLPKTIDDKKQSGIGLIQGSRRDALDNIPPYQDPREQWLQEENRRNESLHWNSEDKWYDERRDMSYDSPDKYMAQSSSERSGYDRRLSPGRGGSIDYGHRSDSFRDRDIQDEYHHNYGQDWDPINRPERDYRYDRSYEQEWGAERGTNQSWKEERSSGRIWDDRRERSQSRERGILGAPPEAEEGILGAPPKDYFDRFSDKISAKKKDWNYDYDYDRDKDLREWGPPGKPRDTLSEGELRHQWNESYSRQQEWDQNAGQMPRDWSPGRYPERDNMRDWGSATVSESFRSSERDIRGKDLAPIRSPGKEGSSKLRLDGMSPRIGNFTGEQPSPGRPALLRGRSPLSSSEVRTRSPVRPASLRGRSPLSSSEVRSRSPGRPASLQGRSPLSSSEVRSRSPGRPASLRGRSPLSSSEVGTRSPHRSLSQKLSPTTTSTLSKTERSSSPNISGRNPASEVSTPISTFGQPKNKAQSTICVKNLPSWTDEQSLKNVLSFEYKKYGNVTQVDVHGTAAERYAVIFFRKPHEAQDAIFDSKNKVIFGQTVMVSLFDGELPLEEPKVYTAKSDYDYKKLLVGYKGEEYEALRSILEVFKKECQKFREQPSSHPQYNEEYHIFCVDKQSKILSLGGDPTQYDILPEWKAYWPRRLEELFGVSWQTMKKQCLSSLVNKKEMISKKLSSSSSKKNKRSPSPRSDKSSKRKHRDKERERSSHSKSHASSSHHREKSRSRRRRSSSRSSTESSSTPRRDKHKDRHTEKHKKSRRKRERSSSHSSSSTERSESKKKTPRKKEKKELPSEDPMEDGEIREDDLVSDVSKLTSTTKYGGETQKDITPIITKKYDGETQKENYQDFIKQRMSDVLGHAPDGERNKSTKLIDKDEKNRKKKSKFPNESYPYTTDGSPKVSKNHRGKYEPKTSRLVSYESEDDHEHTLNKRENVKGGGALGALMAQYSDPGPPGVPSSSSRDTASSSHSASSVAISPLKVCGNIIQMIDILGVADQTISSVGQPLKKLFKQAMTADSDGSDPTEVFRDGKATVNLTSCKLAILAESGTISKSNRRLYQEVLENMDKLMKVDQHFVEGINIERISKKTMEMDVSEAIQSIRKELHRINPSANISEDKVMNLYMEIKKRQLMYSLHNYHDN